jgi:hypothetical protein
MSNADIVVVRANAHRKADGILIYGDVRRTDGYARKVEGHLHIVALNESGNPVATIDAPWGEFMSRRFRLAYFKVKLRLADQSSIEAISVEPVTASTPGTGAQ